MDRTRAGKKTIDALLHDWEKFFDKRISGSRRDYYAIHMGKMDEEDLCYAAATIKQKELQFPTMETVNDYVERERERRVQKEKRQEPTVTEFRKALECTPVGKELVDLWDSLNSGRLSRDEYLKAMYAMERKYPGVGWERRAKQLQAFWLREPKRHEIGKNYLEHIWSEVDQRRNENRQKIRDQFEWIKKNT